MMRRIILAAAVALSALGVRAEGWLCPVLNRTFDFPYAWAIESEDPPLSMDSKYAIVTMDAGLEYLGQWMRWNVGYTPTNYAALANNTLSNRLLPREFFQSMYGKFRDLVNSDYHYTYTSGEMTNEVLALCDNVEFGETSEGSGEYHFYINDFRHIYPHWLLPEIGSFDGSLSVAETAVSNAIHRILGADASRFKPWHDPITGTQITIGDVIYANDYPYSWGMALDLGNGEMDSRAFKHILINPFYGVVRHLHYAGLNIPQMFMHCKSRTPYTLTEAEDDFKSYTTYFCQLTTNANNSADLKLNFVSFDTTTSNKYTNTRPITYGETVSGRSCASGSPSSIVLANLPMEKCIRGKFDKMFDLPNFGNVPCHFYNIGYRIATTTNFGIRLPYIYTVRHHRINKGSSASGFPRATSDLDYFSAHTLYNYKCEGEGYYGQQVSYDNKGVLSTSSYAGYHPDPYLLDATNNLPTIDGDIKNISSALHDHPIVQVRYDNTSPTFHFEPMEVPGDADLCLVTINAIVNEAPEWSEVVVGWVSTNTWTFIDDPNASWIGEAPPATYTVQPAYEEVDGDYFYERPYYWELPFSFSIDMFAGWVSQRWLRWE
jgi:hypothetical protein